MKNFRSWTPEDFVRESNFIEPDIRRDPTKEELDEFKRFMELDEIKIADLEQFVGVYQPRARLRMLPSDCVRIGNHFPAPGGPRIFYLLQTIIDDANKSKNEGNSQKDAYRIHCDYEILHPFMDGNGRSGRMLWMWMMEEAPLGFLHTFYYQALENSRE